MFLSVCVVVGGGVCGVRLVFVAGVLDALPGEVGEGGVEFDAEPVALVFLGDDGGGAGSEEGVQYDAGFAVWVGVGCVVWGCSDRLVSGLGGGLRFLGVGWGG